MHCQYTICPCLGQPDSPGPSRLEQMCSVLLHHLAGIPAELWPWRKPLACSSPTDSTAGHPGECRNPHAANTEPTVQTAAFSSLPHVPCALFSSCEIASGGQSPLLQVQGCREYEVLLRPNPGVAPILGHVQHCTALVYISSTLAVWSSSQAQDLSQARLLGM